MTEALEPVRLPSFTKKRRPPDDGLRSEVRKYLGGLLQLTSIETATTSGGVPDIEYAADRGVTGWIECKAARGWAVKFRPGQPGWINRRARLGGRVFIFVRKRTKGSDELWVCHGRHVLEVARLGLRASAEWTVIRGFKGPPSWDWDQVLGIIARRAA